MTNLDSKGGMVGKIALALYLRINLKCRKVTAWIDKLLLSHDSGLTSNAWKAVDVLPIQDVGGASLQSMQ